MLDMVKKNKTQRRAFLHEIYHILYTTFGPQNWWPGETPFEMAVGAILTQNTNWGNVERAIDNLKHNKLLNACALNKMKHEKIALQIRSAGYYNMKAKRLKEFVQFLMEYYEGHIENMKKEDTFALREKLLDINGIGPETADSILLYALEKPVFVIDAYTKRILARHNIVSQKATYHEIQALFYHTLPQDTALFNEYHALLVKLGKDYCKTKPVCKRCPLETYHSKEV
jgi:endonuclease-3 related protein